MRSWHYQPRILDDGREIPVLYAVTAAVRGGTLVPHDLGGNWQAVSVEACIVQPRLSSVSDSSAKALKGRFAGYEVHQASSRVAYLSAEVIRLVSRHDLEEKLIGELEDAARARAIQPYIDGFVASGSDEAAAAALWSALQDGLYTTDSVRVLFTARPEIRQQAAAVMLDGLNDQGIDALRSCWMARGPTGDLRQVMAGAKALSRYEWLVENLAAIRRDMADAVRHGVIFGYAEAFDNAIQAEKAKLAELDELTQSLSETMPANDWVG